MFLPAIATCLCHAGEPVPFYRILFHSLVLFSYDPFLSFPASMGILCVLFLAIATCLCPVGEPVPFSRILLPSLVLVSYDVPFLSFPFLFFYALFAHWSKSAVFCCSFHGHSMRAFPHYSHVFVPCGGTCSLLSYPLPFFCPFLLWCSFPFLCFYALFAHWSESAVFCCKFHGYSMCAFPRYRYVLVPCGGTCSFSRILFPFLVLFS